MTEDGEDRDSSEKDTPLTVSDLLLEPDVLESLASIVLNSWRPPPDLVRSVNEATGAARREYAPLAVQVSQTAAQFHESGFGTHLVTAGTIPPAITEMVDDGTIGLDPQTLRGLREITGEMNAAIQNAAIRGTLTLNPTASSVAAATTPSPASLIAATAPFGARSDRNFDRLATDPAVIRSVTAAGRFGRQEPTTTTGSQVRPLNTVNFGGVDPGDFQWIFDEFLEGVLKIVLLSHRTVSDLNYEEALDPSTEEIVGWVLILTMFMLESTDYMIGGNPLLQIWLTGAISLAFKIIYDSTKE